MCPLWAVPGNGKKKKKDRQGANLLALIRTAHRAGCCFTTACWTVLLGGVKINTCTQVKICAKFCANFKLFLLKYRQSISADNRTASLTLWPLPLSRRNHPNSLSYCFSFTCIVTLIQWKHLCFFPHPSTSQLWCPSLFGLPPTGQTGVSAAAKFDMIKHQYKDFLCLCGSRKELFDFLFFLSVVCLKKVGKSC